MTDFRRKPLIFTPLWGTAAGNAMPEQGCDLATHTNTASQHQRCPARFPNLPARPFPQEENDTRVIVGSGIWGSLFHSLARPLLKTSGRWEERDSQLFADPRGPAPQSGATREAAAPQRDAPPPPPQPDGAEAHTGPGGARAATNRAEHAGVSAGVSAGPGLKARRASPTFRHAPTAWARRPRLLRGGSRKRSPRCRYGSWARRAGPLAAPAAPTVAPGGRQQSPRGARASDSTLLTWFLLHLFLFWGVLCSVKFCRAD